MKIRFLAALLLVMLFGCTPPPVPEPEPEPEPPPTTTVPADPEPDPDPDPGPDVSREPSEYIRVVRVPSILQWQSSVNIGLIAGAQAMSSAGWRDPLKVLTNCPWAFEGDDPFLGMSRREAIGFAEAGAGLTRIAEDNFIPRFPIVNRRCATDHPQHHPDFCKVTNIRKDVYRPFGSIGNVNTPRGSFWHHLDGANVMRKRAGACLSRIMAANGKAFDSIAGWCTSMNDLGWRAEDCR